MFNTLRDVHSLSMSAVPRSGLILIIVVIISLIAEGDAQNSSQVASSAVPQTSAQTIAQSSESPIIYPDDSCNPEHKDLIYQAFGDAMQMTKLTTQSTIDYIDDPAFWHIFGQRAVDNTTAIKNAFEQVNDGQWSISATCNFGNSTRCDGFAMYGGIAEEKGDAQRRSNETQLYSPHLVFCRDFFALPPLDHRVQMGINHPTDFKARYTLGYFHDNQATTLLRTLFHYLPQSDDLHRPISDLWIFVRQNLPSGVIEKWSACYGIACAKVLARVDDNANDWASVNADGYALFALSRYVAPYINNNFPFFPKITDGRYFSDLAFANNGGDDAPIQVNMPFQIPLLFQPNYQASRLQPDRNVFDVEASLDPDRRADITRVPYVRSVPENSASTKEEVWAHAFSEATNGQLLNIDTTYNRTCFGQNSNLHPYAKDFNGNEAVDLATTFCEDIIKDWDYATPIPPTVRDTSHFRNASREYPLTQVSAQAHLGFFAVADPATFIQPRSAKQFFEGGTDEAKVEHCKLTYKDIIKGVRHYRED
ncbi:hypothetical protein B0T12DRAFT_139472 [Alternaria alternata]|nr:hypothetical protein B0T12DRAFT_139472 [Alternaria alternata]